MGYRETLKQGAYSPNIKRLLLIEENQISQGKQFRTFLFMGRYKSVGLLKPFLSCVYQQSWESICVFHTLSFLEAHHTEWLQSDGCRISFLNALRAQEFTLEEYNL